MDPRFVVAFDFHRGRLARAVLFRVATFVGVLTIALYVRHWGTWTLFGVLGTMSAFNLVMLTVVGRSFSKARARYEAEPTALAWVHSAPEPRTKLHRVELHDRFGEVAYLFVPSGHAAGLLEAAQAQSPTPILTRSDEERATAEPLCRFAAKLARAETSARAAVPPKLRAETERVVQAVIAWQTRFTEVDADARKQAETCLDELLHLYASAELGKGTETFTSDIGAKTTELRALADRLG